MNGKNAPSCPLQHEMIGFDVGKKNLPVWTMASRNPSVQDRQTAAVTANDKCLLVAKTQNSNIKKTILTHLDIHIQQGLTTCYLPSITLQSLSCNVS